MTRARSWAAAAAGALLSGALPPYGLWPLLLALSALFALVARSGGRREAFRLGFLFGLGFFALYILWLPASFSTPEFFGSWFWLLYPPLLLLLASFWGLVTLTAHILGGGGSRTLALLPPLWVLMEWARTQGYFAFPWGTLGYAWLDTPVAQIADIVGVWGLSLLAATLAALAAAPFAGGGRNRVPGRLGAPLAALSLLVTTWLVGGARLDESFLPPDRTALLVQGDLDPMGRLFGAEDEVEIQARLTEEGIDDLESPPDLVVWPEGAVLSGFGGERGAARLERIQASSPESVFLVGARLNDGFRSYNSAYTIADGRVFDRYDKYYLVPFGERFPFADAAAPLYRSVFGLFGLAPLSSTSQGEAIEPLSTPLGDVAAYICYESVFPQVQRLMAGGGAGLLVNITNDAWFARGTGAAQHYDMGRMRAIETRRYLLRAGNDGITGVVDPLGRTLGQLERGTTGVMAAPFAILEEVTPYVRWGWLLVPLLLTWVALAAALGRLPALQRRMGATGDVRAQGQP